MTAPNSNPTTFIAKLIGPDDHLKVKEFSQITEAIRWLIGSGLAEVGGRADRAEIYFDGALVWTKKELIMPERKQTEHEEMERLLAEFAERTATQE